MRHLLLQEEINESLKGMSHWSPSMYERRWNNVAPASRLASKCTTLDLSCWHLLLCTCILRRIQSCAIHRTHVKVLPHMHKRMNGDSEIYLLISHGIVPAFWGDDVRHICVGEDDAGPSPSKQDVIGASDDAIHEWEASVVGGEFPALRRDCAIVIPFDIVLILSSVWNYESADDKLVNLSHNIVPQLLKVSLLTSSDLAFPNMKSTEPWTFSNFRPCAVTTPLIPFDTILILSSVTSVLLEVVPAIMVKKCLVKLLVNRIAPSLHQLVSDSQSAFIKRRCIQENFIYTQNLVKDVHR